MSVPPEMLQRLMASRGGAPGGAPGGGMPAPGGMPMGGGMGGSEQMQSPAGAPASKAVDKKGAKTAALTNLKIAQNMIEQALTAFDPEDQEYTACLKALQVLSKAAGKNDASDLVPAEIMRMVGQMPQMGGGTPMQRATVQQLRQQQQPVQNPGQ